MNHEKHRHRGKPTEPATAPKPKAKGAWTHIKRSPCKTLTREEIEALNLSGLLGH